MTKCNIKGCNEKATNVRINVATMEELGEYCDKHEPKIKYRIVRRMHR